MVTLGYRMQMKNVKKNNITRAHIVDVHEILVTVQ